MKKEFEEVVNEFRMLYDKCVDYVDEIEDEEIRYYIHSSLGSLVISIESFSEVLARLGSKLK